VARRNADGYVRKVSSLHIQDAGGGCDGGRAEHTCAMGGKANFSDSDGVGAERSW